MKMYIFIVVYICFGFSIHIDKVLLGLSYPGPDQVYG